MKPIKVKNPQWLDESHTQINCQVEWSRYPSRLMPFTASSTDNTAHGQELWNKLLAGYYGVIAESE